MKLLIQEKLISGISLDDIKYEHGVKYHETNGKICFNYDQIESKPSDKLANQCRGLVLQKDTWEILACPFFRFFNLDQEGVAAPINWSTAEFQSKLDGTLIYVYFDYNQNKWCSGTRSRAEADGNINNSSSTFSDLVNHTCTEMYGKKTDLQDLMSNSDKQHTYMFELTTPVNQVVCQYNDFKLTLLGVRDNISILEKNPNPSYFKDFNITTPSVFKFDNLNHMYEVFKNWSPKEYEGVVVKDHLFNRVKVKTPSYLALHHMTDSLQSSLRGCAELILLGKDDDIVPMMSNYISNRIIKLKGAINKVFSITYNDFNHIKHISDKKEFALKATKCLWPAALFSLKTNKINNLEDLFMKDYLKTGSFNTSQIKNLIFLCEKVDNSIKNI